MTLRELISAYGAAMRDVGVTSYEAFTARGYQRARRKAAGLKGQILARLNQLERKGR